MEARTGGNGFEDFSQATERIRTDLLRLISRSDVIVVETRHDFSTPRWRQPEQVFVYANDGHTIQSLGTPLTFSANCGDPNAWVAIDAAFERMGFEKFGPMAEGGTQTYTSKTRAWFVVAINPLAARAVDQTGKAALGWIASR